jgi:hypothetical protein
MENNIIEHSCNVFDIREGKCTPCEGPHTWKQRIDSREEKKKCGIVTIDTPNTIMHQISCFSLDKDRLVQIHLFGDIKKMTNIDIGEDSTISFEFENQKYKFIYLGKYKTKLEIPK